MRTGFINILFDVDLFGVYFKLDFNVDASNQVQPSIELGFKFLRAYVELHLLVLIISIKKKETPNLIIIYVIREAYCSIQSVVIIKLFNLFTRTINQIEKLRVFIDICYRKSKNSEIYYDAYHKLLFILINLDEFNYIIAKMKNDSSG